MSVRERFDAKWIVWPGSGCRVWMGASTGNGYGQFWIDGRLQLAHRVAYELDVGPIPDGFEVDHVRARGCITTLCVWSAHMEAVTGTENNRRSTSPSAVAATKTHCPAGHLYDEANTYVFPDGRHRQCRECHRRHDRVRYHRLRGTV